MAKIEFNVKYRPQIESGEYELETRNGHKARIVCWDVKHEKPILALLLLGSCEFSYNYYVNGHLYGGITHNLDLIIKPINK